MSADVDAAHDMEGILPHSDVRDRLMTSPKAVNDHGGAYRALRRGHAREPQLSGHEAWARIPPDSVTHGSRA